MEVLGSQMKFQPLLDRTFDDFELGFPSSFLVSWSNLLSLKRAMEPQRINWIKLVWMLVLSDSITQDWAKESPLKLTNLIQSVQKFSVFIFTKLQAWKQKKIHSIDWFFIWSKLITRLRLIDSCWSERYLYQNRLMNSFKDWRQFRKLANLELEFEKFFLKRKLIYLYPWHHQLASI